MSAIVAQATRWGFIGVVIRKVRCTFFKEIMDKKDGIFVEDRV